LLVGFQILTKGSTAATPVPGSAGESRVSQPGREGGVYAPVEPVLVHTVDSALQALVFVLEAAKKLLRRAKIS
jgi:hypothetical protein